MTDSADNSNRWIDGELRRVPLPDGLLARLRRIAERGGDDELDEQLCAVDLPQGLLDRLSAIVDDEPLDRRIADVPLPDELLARLAQIPDDEALDEQVRNVPIPAALVPSTLATARRLVATTAMRRWSVAAAVMIAVGAAYFSALDYLVQSLVGGSPLASRPVPELPSYAGDLPGGDPRNGPNLAPPAGWNVASEPLALDDLWPDAGGHAVSTADALAFDAASPLRRPSALDISSSWPYRYDLFSDAADRDPLLTARLDSMDVPPLEAARPVAAHGVKPPATPGYDRLTLARTGVHPFVEPSAHPLLESSPAPLVRSTASFDALRWRLLDEAARRKAGAAADSINVLSSASVRVRTEEFLAAMRYDFPPPTTSPVAIRTAAGPSPFAAANVRLLQVGVQAATLPAKSREPVELTIAVDVSAPMEQSGRLELVRRALSELIDRLRAEDRVTLVAFGATAKVLAQQSPPGNPALHRAVADLKPQQGANFHAGMERATRLARESTTDAATAPRRRLVVFADAPTFVTPAERVDSRHALAAAGDSGVDVTLIDLSQSVGGDVDLSAMAAAAGGVLRQAASLADAQRWLDETLFARSTIVAADVELSLRFNPRAVASYRLVGHEATLGLPTAPVKVSLRSGEAATVLFEVVLRDDGTNDVGVAELEWVDPASGKKQLLTQPISRVQFANSLAESSISLQAAAVAAEAAEILRGARSATASPEHSLQRTLQVAAAVHPRLREQSEFRALVDVIRLAEEAGLGRTAP